MKHVWISLIKSWLDFDTDGSPELKKGAPREFSSTLWTQRNKINKNNIFRQKLEACYYKRLDMDWEICARPSALIRERPDFIAMARQNWPTVCPTIVNVTSVFANVFEQ